MRHSAFALPILAALILAAPATAKEATSSFVGGFEGMLGFPGNLEVDGFRIPAADGGEDTVVRNFDTATSFGLVPWVEKKLGEVVGVGGEMMFVWMKGEDADERRLVLSPHLRVRMSFPIIDKVNFDGFLAGGPTMWTAVGDEKGADELRLGWSMRFGFGGSYAINDAVSVYGHLGWYTTTTYGDDVTANMHTVPLCVGLRGNF